MITLIILAIAALVAFALIAFSVLGIGATVFVLFGDLIVCIFIISLIIFVPINRNKKAISKSKAFDTSQSPNCSKYSSNFDLSTFFSSSIGDVSVKYIITSIHNRIGKNCFISNSIHCTAGKAPGNQ